MRATSQTEAISTRGNPSVCAERAYRGVTIAFVLLLLVSL
jgi:hypothetical protein